MHAGATIKSQLANLDKRKSFERAADKLSRKVVATLPDYAGSDMALRDLPEIKRVRTNADPTGMAKGKQLVVVMEGTPGLSATMNLRGVQDYIPMTETPAGVYTGAFVIPVNATALPEELVCRIQDRSGSISQKTIRLAAELANK